MTKVITKVVYQNALDANPTITEVVQCNHLIEYFPRDNELPNFLSNYNKPFNHDKNEHFYNEDAKNRLSQSNQPIYSFVEQQYLNDYLVVFPDTCGPSRVDTTNRLPVKNNLVACCHPTPNLLASSLDSGIQQSSPHSSHSFFISTRITSHT